MADNAAPAPASAPTTDFTLTVKWPWRAEEYVCIVLALAIGVGVGFLTSGLIRTLIMAAGVVCAALLVNLGRSRKSKSAVTLTYTGARLSVDSKGAIGRSAADLSKVRAIDVRRFGSDQSFILISEHSSARVPLRATTDPRVQTLLDAAFERSSDTSPEARRLREQVPSPTA